MDYPRQKGKRDKVMEQEVKRFCTQLNIRLPMRLVYKKMYCCRQIVEQWVNWPCALMMVNVLLFDLVAAFFAARKVARWIRSRCLETKDLLVNIYNFLWHAF